MGNSKESNRPPQHIIALDFSLILISFSFTDKAKKPEQTETQVALWSCLSIRSINHSVLSVPRDICKGGTVEHQLWDPHSVLY